MTRYTCTALLIISALSVTCGKKPSTESTVTVIPETYETAGDSVDNIDSPAFWHGSNGEHWLIVTAKETDRLMIYDADTGSLIKTFGSSGDSMGQFRRPNGIAVTGDLMMIVERDNHRVQLIKLPQLEPLGTFGETELRYPYGICVQPHMESGYRVYVTDNYETEEGSVPPAEELDHRVHAYSVQVLQGEVSASLDFTFGDTSGEGMLKVVESIWLDEANNILLIADEDSTERNLKVYDLDGRFTGKVVGDGLFREDPEGIVLYSCDDGTGFWIATDQSHTENIFYLLDRQTFEVMAAFRGTSTTNTDGIAVTQKSFGIFTMGAFAALNNDASLAVFDLSEILKNLELPHDCTE